MKRALALLLLAACHLPQSNPPPPEQPDSGVSTGVAPLPELKPGTGELLSGLSGLFPHVFDAIQVGPTFVALVRVGDRALVYRPGDTSSKDFIVTSDDQGLTWTSHPLPDGLGPTALIAANSIYVIATSDYDFPVYRLDKNTFAPTRIGAMKAAPTIFADGVASGAKVNGSTIQLSRFDAALETFDESSAALTDNCSGTLAASDVTTFETACYLIDKRCWVTVHPGDAASQLTCFGYQDWPIPFRATQRFATFGGHAWLLWEDQSKVFARRMENGALTPAVELGLGNLEHDTLQTLYPRPAFAPLLALTDAGRYTGGQLHRRLQDVESATPREVVVPLSPCVDDSACPDLMADVAMPDQRLQRVLPVGGDRYLVFYALFQPPPAWASPSAKSWHLVARVANNGEVPAGPFITDGLLSGRGNVIPYVPAPTALEQMCSRAIACFPELITLSQCIDDFSQITGADPTADVTLKRFLATPPGDCTAFRTTYPKLAFVHGGCGNSCLGAWAVNCDNATFYDCEALGTTCTVSGGRAACGDVSTAACGCDSQGRAVMCSSSIVLSIEDCPALGQTCQPVSAGGACTTGVCAGTRLDCDAPNNILVGCENGVPSHRTDCTRAALGCEWEVNTAECAIGAPFRTCQPYQRDGCDGPYLVYCLGMEQRFVDCPALGFAGCTDSFVGSDRFARCSP